MSCTVSYKVMKWGVLIIALAMATLATFWPHAAMADVMYVTRFFDVMIPILAVGALLKYLFCHKASCE